MKKFYLFSFTFFTAFSLGLKAQSNLFIDYSYTPEEMVQDFFDNPNVITSNVVYSGAPGAIAFFDAEGTNLGLGAGILFSTGLASSVADSAMAFATTFNNTSGDYDLNLLMADIPNFDAAIIEFDFTVTNSDTLRFNYVFGSEEYPEFTCTNFNDGFGFLVSGPGISGTFSNNSYNICTVPNSMETVAINTLNDNPACGDPDFEQYYINNESGTDIVFDGMTIPLPASFYAVGGETYHAKLLIGDGADATFDSGVFLSFNSLGADSLLIPPTQFNVSLEGGAVAFTNYSKYAREWFWDFGNGVTSTERNPEPITYDEPGTYTVSLTTRNFCCSETYSTTVDITTGLLQPEVSESWKVFPNPAKDKVSLINPTPETVREIRLLNAMGQQWSVDFITANGNLDINLPADMPAGVYFIQVHAETGNLFASRFVKE